MNNIIKKIISKIQWVRYRLVFGKIIMEIRSIDGGVVSEIAYLDRDNKLVGYWAYGHFDPHLPYNEKINRYYKYVGRIT